MKEQTGNQEDQTMKRKFSMKQLLIGLMTTALVAGGALFYSTQLLAAEEQSTEAPPKMPPMPVETVEVKIADSDQNLLAVGTLHSNESVVVMSEIPGRIEKVGFREGQKVKKGQLLFKLDSAVLQAEFDRAEATRALSEENYQRAESLLAVEAISQQERDEYQTKWQLDEATTRLAKAQLDKAAIRTPFAGTVGLRTVSVGDYVQPGQLLVNLEDLSQLKVDFRIPEKYSAQVQAGQKIALTTDAYGERQFVGEIYAINPLIDEQSRSLVARGLIDNRDGKLRPGQFARVALTLETKTEALFIPEQALIPQPATPLVFKVVAGKAEMVPVQTGQRRKGWVEITSGLIAGDVVVTGGHQKIGPGSPVHAITADPDLFSKFDQDEQAAGKDQG